MKISKYKILSIILFLIYITLFILFINMALEDAEKSTQTSSGVTDVVVDIIEAVTPDDYVVNREKVSIFTRKVIGHFGYNVLMGIVLMFAVFFLFKKDNTINLRYLINYLLLSLFGSILIAIISELLQLIPTGRSCEFKDMLIDLSGGIFGILISYLLIFLVYKIKKGKKMNSL